jgi:Mg-chelatase subunit ChlD
VARWLGDVRTYFPAPVVQVLQRDALERLDLRRLLLEPELLEAVEPDVALAATLVSLSRVMPERARASAREVVRRVVEQLEARLRQRTRQAVGTALDRSTRSRRPRRAAEVDWSATIRANLRHWQPERRRLVAERVVGVGRRSQVLARHVVLCVDQSASMAGSVVHAGVLAATLAGIRTLRTSLVVFDTAVVDLTDLLDDPVDVLFATQLGGGTDIARALAYATGLVERPRDTVVVLVSDLFEGGDRDALLERAGALLAAGAQLVVLLALDDDGAPAHDPELAQDLATLGAPVFACTPDAFPDLMAAALEGRDVGAWAAEAGLVTARPSS